MKSFAVSTIVVLAAITSFAQSKTDSDCKRHHSAPPPGPYSWAPDTRVSIYIERNQFTSEQVAALQAAMSHWTRASISNGTGVTFGFAGDGDGDVKCSNCIVVTRQKVRKTHPKYLAYFEPLKRNWDGSLARGRIVFDEGTTKPSVLQTFMLHELGHGLGLWDCPSCKKTETLMRGFPSVNSVNGAVEPSRCDLEVVRAVYEARRQ